MLVSECVLGDESGTGNLQVDDEVVIVRNTVGLVVITRGTSVDGAEPNVAVVVEAQGVTLLPPKGKPGEMVPGIRRVQDLVDDVEVHIGAVPGRLAMTAENDELGVNRISLRASHHFSWFERDIEGQEGRKDKQQQTRKKHDMAFQTNIQLIPTR